jgi:hypothetical protein
MFFQGYFKNIPVLSKWLTTRERERLQDGALGAQGLERL